MQVVKDEASSADEKCMKRNYSTPRKFRQVWLETFSWIKEVDGRAFCMACERTLVNHLTHLKKHEENDRHIQKSLRKYFSGFPPSEEPNDKEKYSSKMKDDRSMNKDDDLDDMVQEAYMNDEVEDHETTTVVFSRVDSNPIELGEETAVKWQKVKFRKELDFMKKEHQKRVEHMQDKHELEKRIMIAKHNLEMKILKQKFLPKA